VRWSKLLQLDKNHGKIVAFRAGLDPTAVSPIAIGHDASCLIGARMLRFS
jgi:hypothetical protein